MKKENKQGEIHKRRIRPQLEKVLHPLGLKELADIQLDVVLGGTPYMMLGI